MEGWAARSHHCTNSLAIIKQISALDVDTILKVPHKISYANEHNLRLYPVSDLPGKQKCPLFTSFACSSVQ